MEIVSIAQIKNWFKNGLKPTQEHFWNWMDSYWHKDEQIPMSSVIDLENQLANHTHSDLAKRDASNLQPDDVLSWQEALAMSQLETLDSGVKLTQNHAHINVTDEDTQAEFNAAVESILVSVDEQLAEKLEAPTAAGTYIVKVDSEGNMTWKPAGLVYDFKGSVQEYADLLAIIDPQPGDVYNVETADPGNNVLAGDNLAWTGTQWDNLGGIFDASNLIERWEFTALENKVITTEPQTLSPEQQAQARANIGVSSGGGGASVWGEITGDISDQTDLNAALGGKSNAGHTHDYGDLDNLPVIPEDVSDLTDTTDLLFSGDYDDLENKPNIPAAQVNSDWEATSGVEKILNKPAIPSDIGDLSDADNLLFSGDYDDLDNKPTIPQGTVTSIEVDIDGDAISVGGSPITGSGTIELYFGGNSSEYIDGEGNLREFPNPGGSYTAGEGIDITDDEISVKAATSSQKGGVKVWSGLQSDYDLIAVKDPDTLYYIEDKIPDTIAEYELFSAATFSTTGTVSLVLNIAIFPDIWDRTYDWDLVWRDANGLHNLRNYQGGFISKINNVSYSGGGLVIDWIKTNLAAGDVVVPVGAKLVLRLSDNAPSNSAK